MITPARLFLSYAHEDESWANRLRMHFAPLRHSGLIEVWFDRDIVAGQDWHATIADELNSATIILALVSPSFLDSDYIRGVEMARAFERHLRRDASVVPVILRAIDWQATPLGRLLALPRDGKPVLSHRDRDQALREVSRGVRRLLSLQTVGEPTLPSEPERPGPLTLFVNHTSFLRMDRQDEFRKRTGVPLDHYDIRVVVDSEDESTLDRIERVEYRLDDTYPEPIRVRTARDRRERFLLKELANGEYLLRVSVYMRGGSMPLELQRYITLWPSGPEL